MIFIITTILILLFISYVSFEKSYYKQITNASFWKVRFNTGLYGEYRIVNELQKIPGIHKTLVNLYIPKAKGEGLTEIDILFIHENGLYVIESKNYSGWIYGREKDYKWTQVFKNGKKFKFYNPVKQNRTHVNALQKLLSNLPTDIFSSLIIFSDRCTLKSIEVTSQNVQVMKRKNLLSRCKNSTSSYSLPVYTIYTKLQKYTNVSDQVKNEHIERINEKLS
ncbi:NERD domain-containing protein [Rummeliibacillus sp. TYF005]|uniref:nuclease-related domain-containing protein n=1 Tax=unclassified Rummeliibacillus TaxID=2622809 RepID=UPI000E66B268|nr:MULTISPECIES: nuclease-related domain-containing protein [unclassified Rummeliibacillus]RIJ64838.1 NERD domain-containing protein [Rummeliibacillus sp. POC4]RPJ97434.1 NERD domain-containing protein [Rummeliibacillus sp. TYF005]